MTIYRLTDENFDEVVKNNAVVIVDFWADWCSTCLSFAPIYVQIADLHPEVIFAKVNSQVNQIVSAQFRIQSIPTIIGFKKGREVHRKPGAISGQMLEEVIEKIKNSVPD